MGIFNLFKKHKKGEEKMSTLNEVRKAYEDLSEDDKKTFHQSISDRVHESIAAQERADGKEDSQSAADREHEALGAEHADGKGDVEELHEQLKDEKQDNRDDKQEEKAQENSSGISRLEKMFEERFKGIEEKLEKLSGVTKLDAAKEKYGLGSSAMPDSTKKAFTDEDVKKLLG